MDFYTLIQTIDTFWHGDFPHLPSAFNSGIQAAAGYEADFNGQKQRLG